MRFIRKNGRIIPIKDEGTYAKRGVAIGAGVGVALAIPKKTKPSFSDKRSLATWRRQSAEVLSRQVQVPKVSASDVLRNPSFRQGFVKGLRRNLATSTLKNSLINAAVIGAVGATIGAFIHRKKNDESSSKVLNKKSGLGKSLLVAGLFGAHAASIYDDNYSNKKSARKVK